MGLIVQVSGNRVLVFGEGVRAFLAVIRSLGRSGIEVHAVPLAEHSPALRSRYLKEVHHLPAFDGSRRWITGLLELLERYDFDLLIPSCERSVRMLDAHRADLKGVRVALPSPENMQRLFDKHEMRKLALKAGVPFARGRLLAARDTADSLIGELGLPLIVKPRLSWSLENLVDRRNPLIVRSRQQLAETLEGIGERQDFVVEEFFEGTGVGVEVLACKGQVSCAFQHLRIYEPQAGGGSSVRESQALDDALLEACRKVCGMTAMHGVAMFEFRVNQATGDWLLLEINARFWGSLPLPVALGVDFPRYLYEMLVFDRQPVQVDYRPGIRARNLVLSAYDVLYRDTRKDCFGWQKFAGGVWGLITHPVNIVLGRELSDTLQGDDPVPAFAELAFAPMSIVRRILRPK